MKLFFKIIGYFVLFLILLIVYDLTSVDFKYINRSPITIDVNNVRNPQIKKIVRKADLFLGELYFNLSKKKQDEFYSQDINQGCLKILCYLLLAFKNIKFIKIIQIGSSIQNV